MFPGPATVTCSVYLWKCVCVLAQGFVGSLIRLGQVAERVGPALGGVDLPNPIWVQCDLAWVPREWDWVRALARSGANHFSLGQRAVVVPRGVINPKRAATLTHCRCTVSWTGKTMASGQPLVNSLTHRLAVCFRFPCTSIDAFLRRPFRRVHRTCLGGSVARGMRQPVYTSADHMRD